MKKWVKVIAGILAGVILCLVLAVGGYVLYMQLNYYRIEDNTPLEVENNAADEVAAGETYSIATYNIGFGAYEPEYTFFMDTGEMKTGKKTQGTHARALSEENALKNTEGSIGLMEGLDCDFYFVQEVDKKATRSYNVNQASMLQEAFDGFGYVYCSAFHSPYLFYPLTEPHGSVESGLITLSKYHINESIRRQLPVTTSFITKFTDLDRCFDVNRLPVDNGKELVLVNLHLSAYDKGGVMRKQQLAMLNEVLAAEYEKGNYVIAGGDFNHDIADSIDVFPSEQNIPEWVFQLSDEDLAEGLSFVVPENRTEVPSCRGADIPYEKGVDYTVIVDGFIVSDNVKAVSEVINNEFAYSDHQPVKMTFELK